MTFLERSELQMSKTVFGATRGPTDAPRSQKKRPPGNSSGSRRSVKQIDPHIISKGDNDPQSGSRDRGPLKIAFGHPTGEWQSYLQLVIDGHVRFLQLDRRTWLAEQYDLLNDDRLVR